MIMYAQFNTKPYCIDITVNVTCTMWYIFALLMSDLDLCIETYQNNTYNYSKVEICYIINTLEVTIRLTYLISTPFYYFGNMSM